MKINRYKLSSAFLSLSEEDKIKVLKEMDFQHFDVWWADDRKRDNNNWYTTRFENLNGSIEMTIGINLNYLNEWNDYEFVAIEDDDFGQYYQPFYDCMIGKKQIGKWEFMCKCVANYNEKMQKYCDAGILEITQYPQGE